MIRRYGSPPKLVEILWKKNYRITYFLRFLKNYYASNIAEGTKMHNSSVSQNLCNDSFLDSISEFLPSIQMDKIVRKIKHFHHKNVYLEITGEKYYNIVLEELWK